MGPFIHRLSSGYHPQRHLTRLAVLLVGLFALIVGVRGMDGPAVFGGSPVVLIQPCSEAGMDEEAGLCFVVVVGDIGYSIPVERVEGFRYVPDNQVM